MLIYVLCCAVLGCCYCCFKSFFLHLFRDHFIVARLNSYYAREKCVYFHDVDDTHTHTHCSMFKCFYYCLWRKSWLQLDTRASQPTLSPQYAFTIQFHLNLWENRLTQNPPHIFYLFTCSIESARSLDQSSYSCIASLDSIVIDLNAVYNFEDNTSMWFGWKWMQMIQWRWRRVKER